jgi:SNF2 family DNA or RNA helicase
LDQDVPDLGGLRMLVSDFKGIKEATLPDDLHAELREYQVVGVNWLFFLKEMGIGGILADDMGLGKTIQTLCILEHRSLVVVPTSVLSNWKKEAKRFRPNLRVHIYHGTQRTYDTEADVILTSYAILRNDLKKFQEEEWSVVVLDEAQAIKNPRSQTAQAAFQLRARFRVALTGTPIENRLEELWSQMHFLCPGFLSGIKNFRKQYEVPIANGNQGVAKRLRERIKPFVLRRLKKDVAKELPPRTNMTLYCTLKDEERSLYDAVRAATYESMVRALEEGKKFSVMSALEALLRMRQASCHSGLLPGQTAETSSKVELLIERLLELTAAGHKALVFSQWTQLLNRIEPHLKSNNISFVRLDGSTKNRGDIVDRFQADDGPSIFLASLKAGGTGLNLTAADHVFLMDPWWNPAVEDQAADRAHRIGQDKPVNVYRIVSENTVEEKVLKLQDRKRLIADAALNNAAQASAVTKEELMSLLQ